ncbi:MAG: hypothetical protein HY537_06625 [Deltaproteobacteria bacterium]|nr:hypothetical protein [Deltaproteobacteria bacterium]
MVQSPRQSKWIYFYLMLPILCSCIPVQRKQTSNQVQLLASDARITTRLGISVESKFGGETGGTLVRYKIVKKPTKGVVTLRDSAKGVFVYSPYFVALGEDQFSYKIVSPGRESNEAIVTITILAPSDNHPPVAQSQTVTAQPGSPLSITLVATDPEGDPLTYQLLLSPQYGALSQSAPGSYTYTPDPAVTSGATDSFSFIANDGFVDSEPAEITVNIPAVQSGPLTASSRSLQVMEGQALTIELAPATYQGLTFTMDTAPAYGTLSNPVNRIVTYTPNANFTGFDSFVFHMTNASGDSNHATVTISVTPSVMVFASNKNVCAKHSSGVVKCWGDNSYGQVGLGLGDTGDDGAIGDQIGEITDLDAIDFGSGLTVKTLATAASTSEHMCAVLSDNTLRCWGNNWNGQLGLENSTEQNTPQTPKLYRENTDPTAPPSPAPISSVAIGAAHTCAILQDGALKCWGKNNDYGQLGRDDATPSVGDTPNSMNNVRSINFGTSKAITISAGSNHSCAILDDDTVTCWGNNDNGQLGLGLLNSGNTLKIGDAAGEVGSAFVQLGSRKPLALATGHQHSCALLEDGYVKCWGYSYNGQLGRADEYWSDTYGRAIGVSPDQTFMDVDLGTHLDGSRLKAIQITAGKTHTCALLDDGSVKCWGSNNAGQLGQTDYESERGWTIGDIGNALEPSTLGAAAKWISAGWEHTCAVLVTNEIKCWGRNSSGQLGQESWDFAIGDSSNEMANLNPINLTLP